MLLSLRLKKSDIWRVEYRFGTVAVDDIVLKSTVVSVVPEEVARKKRARSCCLGRLGGFLVNLSYSLFWLVVLIFQNYSQLNCCDLDKS